MLYSHQQSLLANLQEEQEPAMALHLVVVILFQQHTGSIIHMPGKLVPHIISFLESQMKPEDYVKLVEYQRLVTLQWKSINATKSSPSKSVSDEPAVETPKDDNSAQIMEEHSSSEQTELQQIDSQKTDDDKSQLDSQEPSQPSNDAGGESTSAESGADVEQQLMASMPELKQLVVRHKKPVNESQD